MPPVTRTARPSMHRQYHRWWSPSLHRDMELLEFGHGGARVIAFPTSRGRFFEWEDHGMPRALSHMLNNGWLHLTCVDAVDGESWYAYHTHPGARAWRHEQYTSYIVNEVLPWTGWRNGHPYTVLTGASFGAFHALSIGLRHPDKFNRVLSMSGMTDIKGFLGGYHNETVYFQNPVDFIPNESDPWRLEHLRRQDIILAVGSGDRLVHQNRELSGKLWAKGVGNALREWDGFAHDWPVWHDMVRTYVGGHDTPYEKTTMKRVGVIVGREWSFPPKFIEEVNRRGKGVVAEFAKLGGTRMDEKLSYDVLVDRISHEVPYYRSYLKHAVLEGVTVVNNPFMWTADDKFFGASLCAKLGLAHPKTAALPNKDYVPGIVKTESLRNLVYPMDWQAIVDYVGLPCILKDAHGGGWRGVYVCHSIEELIRYYDGSGLLTMIAQEFIKWDQYVRCMCLGRDTVLPMPYDTHNRRYIPDPNYLTPAIRKRVVDDSLKLVNALGYDMNTVEWAIKDGVPYAIDFMNPAPDMDLNSLTPEYFDWVVNKMADLVIDRALNPKPQLKELRWAKLF